MEKNEILNKVFDATAKLELMQTLIGVIVDLTESTAEISTPEAAMYFASQRGKIIDLLHIVFDGVFDAKLLLEKLNNIQEDAA